MCVKKLLTQSGEPLGFLEGVEVATLKIFDETNLQDSPVVDVDLDAWNLRKAGLE